MKGEKEFPSFTMKDPASVNECKHFNEKPLKAHFFPANHDTVYIILNRGHQRWRRGETLTRCSDVKSQRFFNWICTNLYISDSWLNKLHVDVAAISRLRSSSTQVWHLYCNLRSISYSKVKRFYRENLRWENLIIIIIILGVLPPLP